MIEELKNKIFLGEMITKNEAMSLIDAPLDELCKAADEIREKFCDNVFDICTIINAKAEDAVRTASIVHNRRFTAQMLRNISCLTKKQS